MKEVPRILCVPVGRAWEPSVRAQFEQFVSALPDCVQVEYVDPVCDETAILDLARQSDDRAPDLLLLATLHGNSARPLVLAARRFNLPTAIWCHDRAHSVASSALAAGALRDLLHPYVLIHATDPDSSALLVAAAAAAAARRRLASLRIGQLGPVYYNLVNRALNPLTLHARFGVWVVPISLSAVKARLRQVEDGQVALALDQLRTRCDVMAEGAVLRQAAALYVAMRDIAREQRLDIVALDCWNETFPEFGTCACFGLAGDACGIACEGDVVAAIALTVGEAIGGTKGFLGDLYGVDEASNEVTLMHCAGCAELHGGPGKPTVAVQAPPAAGGTPGTVMACHPVLPPGAATIALLHGTNADLLHIRRCVIVRTSFDEQMQVIVQVEGNAAEFCREAAGNHYVVFPGDHVGAWRRWAEWAGVEART